MVRSSRNTRVVAKAWVARLSACIGTMGIRVSTATDNRETRAKEEEVESGPGTSMREAKD